MRISDSIDMRHVATQVTQQPRTRRVRVVAQLPFDTVRGGTR